MSKPVAGLSDDDLLSASLVSTVGGGVLTQKPVIGLCDDVEQVSSLLVAIRSLLSAQR